MTKKLICKKCKEEIDSLDYDVTATCSGNITQDEAINNKITEFDTDSLFSNVEFDNFRCPNCSSLIGFGKEEDARKFLKGEMKWI